MYSLHFSSVPAFTSMSTFKTIICPLAKPHSSRWRPSEPSFGSCNFLVCLRGHRGQLGGELREEDGLVALGAGGDHADPGSAFPLNEMEVLLSLFGQLIEGGDADRRFLPSGPLLVDAFYLLKAGGKGRYRIRLPAIDLVPDAYRDLVQFVENIQLGHHPPIHAV